MTGSCIYNTLPAINSDEVLPIRRQTEYVSGVNLYPIQACPEANNLGSDNWIIKNGMTCDFGIYIRE